MHEALARRAIKRTHLLTQCPIPSKLRFVSRRSRESPADNLARRGRPGGDEADLGVPVGCSQNFLRKLISIRAAATTTAIEELSSPCVGLVLDAHLPTRSYLDTFLFSSPRPAGDPGAAARRIEERRMRLGVIAAQIGLFWGSLGRG